MMMTALDGEASMISGIGHMAHQATRGLQPAPMHCSVMGVRAYQATMRKMQRNEG